MAEAEHVPELVRRDRDQPERSAARLQRDDADTPAEVADRRASDDALAGSGREARGSGSTRARPGPRRGGCRRPIGSSARRPARRRSAAPARRRGRARSRPARRTRRSRNARGRRPALRASTATASSTARGSPHRRYTSTGSPARSPSQVLGYDGVPVGAHEGRQQRRALSATAWRDRRRGAPARCRDGRRQTARPRRGWR